MIPREMQVNQMEVPPMLSNGSVCPVTGNRFTATAMLISAWNSRLNPDILAIEKLIKEIEADKKPAPVLSIEEFIGKKGQP